MTRCACPPSAPPAPSYPTSRCGTGPCWPASAPASTGRACWRTRTPGTSSSKARGSRPSPRHKPWPSCELAAALATSRTTQPRAILLACDDYSAVSGKVPLWQLYERGRSLGIGVQVSAQSWQGLGADEDERYRIAATADGGIWLLRTPYPQPVCELAGTRRIVETATKVIGSMWGDEGSSRIQHAWLADPQLARALDTGQAAYIHAGGCTWVQIARPHPSPLPLPAPPPQPRPVIPAVAQDSQPPAPGRPAALDDAFGAGARP
jgi:hypothetical protein